MAEVINNMPPESLDHDQSPSASAPPPPAASSSAADDLPPPPLPLPPRRRDRRDDRDFDRHPNRSRDYYDRDRDFKRRRSPSPGYRDRRYSPPPPSRRSPPPYKRSRRGSPRGGAYVPDDRFGYDYSGGYERGAGGRTGYADEKSYGRLAHRSAGGYHNGISDVDNSRGYADLPSGGAQREGLMSYKQFIQELEDDVLPAEAERRYQEYKSEYISTQKRAYFNAHKDEEWLKDKYHPTNLLTVIERRNENARRLAKDFLLDLQSGTLDLNPGLNSTSSGKSGQASEPNSEEETDGKRRRHGRGPNKDNDFSAAPKAHTISSEPRRIQADIQQAQAVVRKLDREKGIDDNILCTSDHNKNDDKAHSGSVGPIVIVRGLTSVKGLEGVELLDTLITYLWRIHGVDYYGMIETNEAKGFRYVRPEGTGHEETRKSGSDWEKKLDSFWQGRLNGQDPLEVMTAKEKIDAAATDVLDPHVRKIRDEKYGWKYGCGAKGCTKLFHAAEFVHKHLKLKHPELVMELTSKLREDLYFQNYMNDPDAPGGTPVMQQPQKDRPLKRRLGGLEGRLKDDRGNRRDQDRSDRINGDRPDGSPSHERQMGNHDEAMYDAYGGPGVPQFTSDMAPPPVLMPVPGAGPLGPFVPAPPEVAMQMFREQGGPSSYDASGRKIRSGPHMGGPAPIIAVPPSFRPDPRQMRSYQDLDAPEDEVTVIDYRSL
ncbi:hypothetical protein AAZX31_04G120300 [Glycine max]|uniref:Serrate RNA effector molecule n=2 Tax=Glycine soja TaxID=3848 RepID=A0A445KZN7_GLYSO|nr:serrate RNA effector molecule-like [Glycine soja]RZC16345.1 Serrate RNA effector molecule [Glycine soja]